jgi:carbamoyltransferase|tara:strand:- start:3 stop:1739 length:1737 start_codon:yes stop_codon:yes gene_type:complete
MSSKKLNILGLKIVGHDPGAAIIKDGTIFAISEERLNKIKHSRHIFPNLSIDYCLDAASIKPDDIDLIVIDQIHDRQTYDMEKIFYKNIKHKFSNAKIKIINHHLAHASSAFLCSPFKEAAIMIVDSTGEKIHSHLGSSHEVNSLYYGNGNNIHLIHKTLKSPNTIGVGKLYATITRKFLNLGRYNEGKTMGLASYGDAEKIFKDIPRNMWYKELNGDFICNPKISFPDLKRKHYSFIDLVRRLKRKIFNSSKKSSDNDFFEKIHLSHPLRRKEQKLPADYYSDMAAVAQAIIEEIFLKISRRLHNITRSENLCLAGGCALNGVSNNKILEDGRFKDMFIQPASSDTGIPLGCALWGYHIYLGNQRNYVMNTACLGMTYSDDDIRKAIDNNKDAVKFYKSDNVSKETAKLISEGNIIGWFQGRSEYGPRALGSRSIICDPSRKDMKDTLNEKVKHREGWRPFAASVLAEHVSKYFKFENHDSPFMLFVPDIREEKKSLMPSLVHVDGTCRIQSVTQKDNGLYYDLIKEFYKLTNIPLVLNTSFNLAGNPIIETPQDAINCFLSTDIDYLILGDYIVKK